MDLLDIQCRHIRSSATSVIICHLPAHREESVKKRCQHTEMRSEDGLWRFGCGEVLPDGGSNGGCKAGGRALPGSLWSRCHPFSAPFPMTGESTGLFDLLELTSETTQIIANLSAIFDLLLRSRIKSSDESENSVVIATMSTLFGINVKGIR